jgi:peptidoglycan/LPS O-acetylase OafA/YrhL
MATTTSTQDTHSDHFLAQRLSSLTGVRFYAAFAVALLHLLYTQAIFTDPAVEQAFGITAPLATAAVSVFFVLSGFVLTWSARSADTTGRFWRRRFVKIFPNHLVTWAFAVLFLALFAGGAHMIGTSGSLRLGPTIANLFLVHAWVPDPAYINSANSPNWSLACEAFFYLLFPLLLLAIRRIRRERLWLWAGVVTVLGLAVPCIALLFNGSVLSSDLPLPTLQLWFGYLLPICRLPEFALGMLLARVVQEGRWRPVRVRWAVLALFVTMVVGLMLPPIFIFGPLFAAPAGILVATVAARDLSGRRSHLRSRVMVFLGDRSFALYMSHFVVIAFARQLLPEHGLDTGVAMAVLLLLVLPVVLVVAHLLYVLVERPLYQRFASPRP